METWLRVLVLIAIAGVGVMLASLPQLRFRHATRGLHRRLAAVNGLTDSESAWLWRIARTTSPERPAMVFVRPSLLEFGPAAASPDIARTVRGKLFAP